MYVGVGREGGACMCVCMLFCRLVDFMCFTRPVDLLLGELTSLVSLR